MKRWIATMRDRRTLAGAVWGSGSALLLVSCAVCLVGAQDAEPNWIAKRSFRLLNEKGTTVGAIATFPTGLPYVSFNDADGNERISLGVNEERTAYLRLHDATNSSLAEMETTEKGGSSIALKACL
jgi:hypothetical protein